MYEFGGKKGICNLGLSDLTLLLKNTNKILPEKIS